MKKFGLALLVTCMGVFAACSSDKNDDVKPPVISDNATAVEGTYASTLTIVVPNEDPVVGEKDILLTRVSENVVNLELKDFSFGELKVGDIKLKNVPVTKTSTGYALTETKERISIAEGTLNPTVTVSGYVIGNSIVLNLIIADVFENPIIVDMDGVKSGEKNSISGITSITFAGDFIMAQQPVFQKGATTFTLFLNEGTKAEALKEVVVTIEVSNQGTVSPASGSKVDLSSGSAKFTVTAADGKTTKEYTVKTKENLVSFDMEIDNWYLENPENVEKFHFLSPIGGWTSSNRGVVSLMAFSRADKFCVLPSASEDAYSGKTAARIETINSKAGSYLGNKIPKVTSGSLLLGIFETDLTNPLKSTKFGVPYTKKPLEVKGQYKYKSGPEYFECADPTNPHKTTSLGNVKDECAMSVILYEYDPVVAEEDRVFNEDPANNKPNKVQRQYRTYLTGVDIKTDPNKVITAHAELKDGSEKEKYTSFSLKLDYTKDYDKTKKYRLVVIASSSAKGDLFSGAPESVLFLDDIEIIAE